MRTTTLMTALVAAMAFPAAASITGTVMNSDGKPIGGAKIALVAPEPIAARRARYLSQEPARKPLASTTTDSKGSFSVDAPKDQPFVDLTVDAPGYAPAETWLQSDEEAGAIILIEAPSRTGTVKANGKPVANATVLWIGQSPMASESVSKTDANGRYSVPDPSKWAVRAIVIHPDYALFEEDAPGNVRGRARGPQRDLSDTDLTLTPGVEVRGRVVAADGTPAADADILFDRWPVAKSGADGTFVVTHAPKSWKLAEADAGGRSALRANGASLTMKLARSASANGRVIDAKSQQPVAGAQVFVTSSDFAGTQLIASAISDAKGNYSIAPLVPGTYTLRVLRPGYGIAPQTISVVAGQAVQKTLYGTPHARLIGTVVDENSRPVAAAHITTQLAGRGPGINPMMMMRSNVPVSAWSGPDGRFVLRDVDGEEAPFTVAAMKKGFPRATTSAMKVAAGETKSGITLTIPNGVAFSGKVLDKDGKPVAGAEVDAGEASSNPAGLIRMVLGGGRRGRADESVRTAADGTFSMRVKEATYDFIFRHDGYAMKSLRAQHVTASMKPVVVTLDPGVEITGRVTRGGAPIEGANVSAISPGGFETTTTAADGTFRIGDLTPGQVMLNVSKADAFIMENRPASAPAQNVNFDLPSGGRIIGHVVDKASGNPVTAFTAGVSASRSGGGIAFALPPQMRQFTTDDGTFALDGVRPGPVELVVSAPGYTTSHTTNIEVEDGKATRDIEVTLDTGVKVSGRVTDTSGQPIGGVAVQSVQAGGRMMRFDPTNNGTSTDPNGEFTLEAQEAGEKTYSFTRSGYVSDEKTVTLSGKEYRLDEQLSSGLHVAGMVVSDSGTPIADATVHASSASDSAFGRQMQTDASGGFSFDGLAPGHYTFSASKSGVGTAVLRDVDVTVVNPVRITVSTGATITGHVTGLTADELQNTTVIATGSGTGNMQVPVDSSGAFRFDGAPTGTVRVSARTGAMFAGSKTSDPQTVVVDAGGTAQVDIDFKSNTVIHGRITRNGAPMGSAMVSFRSTSSQSSASATADASGTYQVSGLDDGNYSVQVIDFERLSPFSTTYSVKGSGNFDIDIKTVSVRGHVIDSTNSQPLNLVTVQLKPTSSDTAMMSARAVQTDSSGAFTVDDLARGTYQVTAEKEGYGHAVQALTVSDTPPDDLQLSLAPSDGITLNVVDGRDGRMIGAAAHAVDAQGNSYDAGDNFRFPGGSAGPAPIKIALGPGAYRVTINAPGYASKTINVTSPSTQTVTMTPGGTLLIHSKSNTPLFGRLTDAGGLPYGPQHFPVAPAPGVTTLQTIAAGTYRLDVLDANGQVVASQPVTINEGQPTDVAL